jgi:lauroyl/myristoyl acyltransferase
MQFKDLLNSSQAGKVALIISRLLPPFAGYRLADAIAERLYKDPNLPMVRAIRLNQWVANGESLSANELDEVVLDVLRNITHNFYVLFHYHNRPKTMQCLMCFPPIVEELIQRSREEKIGAVVAGVHMSNFDLMMQATVLHGLSAMALSLPDGKEAVAWQHQLRRKNGVEVFPASFSSMRQSIHRLKSGKTVITGMDYPVHGVTDCPRFFGRKASLPVHYVQLALAAKVPLLVVGAIQKPEGRYQIITSEWLHLKPYSDHRSEILFNAEMALEVAADLIHQAPRQWLVLQPVWPNLNSSEVQ